uniref:(northern house mosquito) hypothetical protein n=1 Tax=Culex pipiens TaxID=7175 RepID=A0A8D8BGB3_CULPI
MLDNNNYNNTDYNYKTDHNGFRVANINNRFLSTTKFSINPYRILYLSNSNQFSFRRRRRLRHEIAAHHLRTGGIHHAGHDQAAPVAERNGAPHEWWRHVHDGQVHSDGHAGPRRRSARNGHDPTQTKA